MAGFLEITKHMSLGVMAASECSVSISRLQRFLETPELGDGDDGAVMVAQGVTRHWNGNGGKGASASAKELTCPANEGANEGATKTTDASGLIMALDDVTARFDAGTLTCVIGPVGIGKSALLQMLAGELPPAEGTLRRRAGRSGGRSRRGSAC